MKKIPTSGSKPPKGKAARLRKLSKAVAAENVFERSLRKYQMELPIERTAVMHSEMRKMIGAKKVEVSAFWQKMLKRRDRFQVRSHKAAYAEALAEVLKVYEFICSLPFKKLVEHVKVLCEDNNTDPSKKKFDLLRLMASYVIDYTCTLEKNKKGIDTHDLSRDARALGWLVSQGITSNKLIPYQRENGGGVDSWSRLASGPADKEVLEKASKEAWESLADDGDDLAESEAKEGDDATDDEEVDEVTDESDAAEGVEHQEDRAGTSGALSEDLLKQISTACDLEPWEILVLHLRGTNSPPGAVLAQASKTPLRGPPGARRAQASRLDRNIRIAIARSRRKRTKRG